MKLASADDFRNHKQLWLVNAFRKIVHIFKQLFVA